jgi:hypothetical protein
VDGDLVHVLFVQGLDVERGVELLLQAGRGVGEQVSEQGEVVEQGGVAGLGIGFGEAGELGVDLGAFVFEFAEAGQGAGAQGGDGGGAGVVEVGQGFDFAGVGVFGGVDLAQPLVQRGGLAVAAGLVGG